MIKRLWSEQDDKTIVEKRKGGMSWKNIGSLVRRTATSSNSRYLLLTAKKAQQQMDENPLVSAAVFYLRKQLFIVFQDGAKYMVDSRKLTIDELIAKAQRVKLNNEILARTPQ